MHKICFVATIPAVVHSFMKGHIRAAAKKWPVAIITNPDGAELLQDMDAQFIPLSIRRRVSPWRDLLLLMRMTMLFHRERFDLVHSIMPKTGLLAMLAGRLAGVPVRLHTFTGQVWANKQGWKRSALRMFDRLIVACATHVLVDSPSQRDFLVSEGVLEPGQGIVIGHGSICGVDAHQFHPDAQVRGMVRAELGIGAEQTVILFLGRLNRDKGVLDLVAAFAGIAARRNDVVLVLVGAEEDVSYALVQELCGEYRDRIRRVEFTSAPQRYMAAADIFCLPSYREGFSKTLIEAAATGLPIVTCDVPGCRDAVRAGETAVLIPPQNAHALANAIEHLLRDPALRASMGIRGRDLAVKEYSVARFVTANLALYARPCE